MRKVILDRLEDFDSRRVIRVGDSVKYRPLRGSPKMVRVSSIHVSCPVCEHESMTVDGVVEHSDGDSIDYVIFDVIDDNGTNLWGYWNQVVLD